MTDTTTPSDQDLASAPAHGCGCDQCTCHSGDKTSPAAQENLEGWQRARADYENLLRRLDAERMSAAAAGGDAVFQALLPLIDSFSFAMAHMPESLKKDSWGEGILRIHRILEGCLREAGVEPIGETGIPLNPRLHEAVTEEPGNLPSGTLTSVVTIGYQRNGRVLRPAKVRVSAGPKNEKETAEDA